MASKSDEYYDDHDEDDDEDEDEGDFVPGGDDDDDDELDADLDDENLEDDEGEGSPFLSGLLYLDGQGKIVFASPTSTEDDEDDQQVLCFTSEEKVPASWSIATPVLDQPLLFAGTLHGQALKLKICISEYDIPGPIDSLDERFLKIQDDLQPLYMDGPESKAPSKAKADDDEEDADSSAKKPARRKAGDDDEEEDSKPTSSRKPSAPSSDKHIFVLNAEQTSTDKNGTSRTIRGVFRIPQACSRILVPAALNIHTSEVGIAASPSAKAASGSVAVAKKRSRDDDEDEGDDGVGYQELIDLHDDAGLSTEELRRRYYGGTVGTDNNKKAKLGTTEEDDDDDAYGF